MKPTVTKRQTAEVNAEIERMERLRRLAVQRRQIPGYGSGSFGSLVFDLEDLEGELLLRAEYSKSDARAVEAERLAHDVRQLAERLRKFGSGV